MHFEGQAQFIEERHAGCYPLGRVPECTCDEEQVERRHRYPGSHAKDAVFVEHGHAGGCPQQREHLEVVGVCSGYEFAVIHVLSPRL